MEQRQFDQQMLRLIKNYSKAAYTDERAALIWKEVSNLSADWLERIVDKFIGEERQAPLMDKFRFEISEERERIWKTEKFTHKKDAEDFFKSIYQADDVRTICQYIIKRLGDGVSDADFEQFVKHLKYTASDITKNIHVLACSACQGEGYIFESCEGGGVAVYRCYCRFGAKKPKAYEVWQRS